LHKACNSLSGEALYRLDFVIPAGQDHRHAGIEALELSEGLFTGKSRHRHVQEHQCDRLALERVDRLTPVFREEDPVPVAL
jgi:hypothetical protein